MDDTQNGNANQKQIIDRDTSSFKIELTGESFELASSAGRPTTLWLGMNKQKETPLLYRHAWGNAYVSETEGGGTPYPVAHLEFHIVMPDGSPNGVNKSDTSGENTSSVSGDCKFYGQIFGDFESQWTVIMDDPYWGFHARSKKW